MISKYAEEPSIFYSSILINLFFYLFWLGPTFAIEYDTSEGHEDIIFISTDTEVNIGDSLSAKVEKRFEVVKDKKMQEKVDKIGQRIAMVCDRKDIIYHFTVIEDKKSKEPIINAFALPGGYVYIFKDLYEKVDSDDELAGVIAHEVGHIVARHSIKKMQASFGGNIFLIVGSQAETTPQNLRYAQEAIFSLLLAYSREDEIFADKLSVKYMKKAGFNPEGVLTFLKKLLEYERKKPARRYSYHRTHPYLSIRISNVKKEIYGKIDFVDYINIPSNR